LENKRGERKAGDVKGVKERMNEIILPVSLSGRMLLVVVVVV
jgi:hypothetical protein